MIRFLVVAGFLAVNSYVYYEFATEKVIPPRETFDDGLLTLGGWTCAGREELAEGILRILGVSDYLICDYHRADGAYVGAYVGYHESQVREEGGGGDENAIHPPRHCLPGSGWDIIEARKVPLHVDGLPQPGAPVNRLIVAKGRARQLVYYWYQSRGRVIADDWKKIVLMSLDRARTGRTDGSLVRLSVPFEEGNGNEAEDRLVDLASVLVPKLAPYLPE